jgi:hypothetical protein
MLNRQYNPPFGGWPKRKDCSIVDGTEEAKSGWLDFRKDGRPVSGGSLSVYDPGQPNCDRLFGIAY